MTAGIGELNINWRGGNVTSSCLGCGAVFNAPRWEMKGRKYCSLSCYKVHKTYHSGSQSPTWNGGTCTSPDGESRILAKDHPRANYNGYVLASVLVVEKTIGRYLSAKHPIHHVDRNKRDNGNGNLVVCQDQAYHNLIHARMRLLEVGGNPNIEKMCCSCHAILKRAHFMRLF